MTPEQPCACVDCGNLFREPTEGGGCPGCGSPDWYEPLDDNYQDAYDMITTCVAKD